MLRRYLVEVIRPTLERGTHFIGVLRAVVRSRYASLVSTNVIENCLDNMRKHTPLSHTSGSGPAKVMDAPGSDAYALV
jgi:hypothetical protein